MSDFNVDWAKLGTPENGDMIPLGGDNEFFATFHLAKVPNFDGTDYDEIPHLRLQSPGNTKAVYDQPVRLESHPGRPSDPERFPRQWADFQRGQTGSSGTSILDLDGVTDPDARRFELLGIRTIEQLASVADVHLADVGMGALALRQKAREHLTGQSGDSALRDEIGKLKDVVAMLLEERQQAETPEAPARRSRSTKETTDA